MARPKVSDAQISLRIRGEDLVEAEDLVPLVGQNPDFTAIGDVTRSTVLRLAIGRGLKVLREEYTTESER